MKKSVEENYILFQDKLSDSSIEKYNLFVKGMNDSIRNRDHFFGCFQLMRKYLRWFYDPHLTISLRNNEVNKIIYRNFFSRFPTEHRKGKLRHEGKLSGIYVSESYGYVVEVLKNINEYVGTIVKGDDIFWFKNQTKFFIKPAAKYTTGKLVSYRKDHLITSKPYDYSYSDSVLTVVNLDVFKKVANIREAENVDFSFCENAKLELVSDSSWYLYLPNFELYQKKIIDSLLIKFDSEIKKRPNLIIDLRNNTGGYSSCFENLLPMIFDKPYQMPAVQFRASSENITMRLKAYFGDSTDNDNYSTHKNLLNNNTGKVIELKPKKIVEPEIIFNNPKAIVMLTDKGVVSSGEHLVFYGRKSDKVTVMGENTAGMFNTLDILYSRKLPSDFFQFNCPTLKYCDIGKIDYIGFPVDVRLKFSEYSQWKKIAQKFLESNGKSRNY